MTRTFIRHYIEMVLAMFIGMGVLAGGLVAAGVDVNSVAVDLMWMAFSMSLPMVAWMRYRGHGWAPAAEMTAAMFIPTFAAIALLSAGLVEGHEALMGIQHVAMFPAMLIAMLLRRDEYSGHVHA